MTMVICEFCETQFDPTATPECPECGKAIEIVPAAELVDCPNCQVQVEPAANNLCPNCGRPLSAEPGHCEVCQAVLAPDATECPECGKIIERPPILAPVICPHCQASVSPTADNLCSKCGQPLAPPAFKCEACHAEFETDPGRFCPNCGRSTDRFFLELENEDEKKRCGKCGHRNPAENNLCDNCGELLFTPRVG